MSEIRRFLWYATFALAGGGLIAIGARAEVTWAGVPMIVLGWRLLQIANIANEYKQGETNDA